MVAVDDAVASLSAAEAVSEKLGSELSITSSSASAFATRKAEPSPIVTAPEPTNAVKLIRSSSGPPAPARAMTWMSICGAGLTSVAVVVNDPSGPVTPVAAPTVPPTALISRRTPGSSAAAGSMPVSRATIRSCVAWPGDTDPGNAGSVNNPTVGRQWFFAKLSRAITSPV